MVLIILHLISIHVHSSPVSLFLIYCTTHSFSKPFSVSLTHIYNSKESFFVQRKFMDKIAFKVNLIFFISLDGQICRNKFAKDCNLVPKKVYLQKATGMA